MPRFDNLSRRRTPGFDGDDVLGHFCSQVLRARLWVRLSPENDQTIVNLSKRLVLDSSVSSRGLYMPLSLVGTITCRHLVPFASCPLFNNIHTTESTNSRSICFVKRTALHWACKGGTWEVVTKLLANGSESNMLEKLWKWTPLQVEWEG